MLLSIIMAGGLGKRMNSDLPKVLHEIKNKPMICYVIDRALDIDSHKILIVVGKYKEIIQNSISQFYSEKILEKIIYIDQPQAFGTGNAIQCCIPFLSNEKFPKNTKILILSGDVPLISFETLFNFINFIPNSNCLMTYKLDNPYGYGRILLDNDNDIVKCIIEEKDCSEVEKKIDIVNCGIYYLDMETCINILPLISNNNKSNEYYLTDMIQLSYPNKGFTKYELPKEKYIEIANINTIQDLEFVKSKL
jgi:bifunctional N-acetylglucosamine-1-phosphate-uridyltransferase/glucosamine-1-phosphate-acetyltransferase GlmU-like protein